MKKFTCSGLIGAALLVAAAAPAQADVSKNVAMTPYIGESLMYTFSDNSRRSDNGIGGMIGGGIPLNRLFNIELDGAYTHFNNDDSLAGSNPWKQFLAKVDGQFFFSRDPSFSPYLGVGVGYDKESETNVGTDSAIFADAGVGAIHYFQIFHTDFGVRGDVRYRWSNVDKAKFPGQNVSNFGEPVLSLGLVIPLEFGSSDTGGGPAPIPVPGPCTGADCTPQPPCKGTECLPLKFEDVHFAFDKYSLTEYAKASLDADASSITKLSGKYPSLKVDVSGHTDWIGTDAYNQALSERRATAVKDYLVRKGIDSGRIRTFAYGESQPVAPNTTAEGRALNRRAEIRAKGE